MDEVARVPGLGQITWWFVCWQKMRDHIGKKLLRHREIVYKWTVGVWEHTDSLAQSPNRASPETNTNTKRILFFTSVALTFITLGIKLLQLPAQLLKGSPGTLGSPGIPRILTKIKDMSNLVRALRFPHTRRVCGIPQTHLQFSVWYNVPHTPSLEFQRVCGTLEIRVCGTIIW